MEMQSSYLIWILLIVVWTIPWKAVALWKSARNGEKFWFVVFLLFNSLAILEIIYLLILRKKQSK